MDDSMKHDINDQTHKPAFSSVPSSHGPQMIKLDAHVEGHTQNHEPLSLRAVWISDAIWLDISLLVEFQLEQRRFAGCFLGAGTISAIDMLLRGLLAQAALAPLFVIAIGPEV